MNRRRWLGGAVAIGAMAAGTGGYLWRERSLRDGPGGLWQLRFAQPGGGELAMSALRGRPLLLNFWATWCPPCIKEMPDLDRFQREFGGAGWQVVGLAIDGAAAVREFLARRPVGYPIGLAGFEGTELARSLGNDAGALPFSVWFDGDGRIVRRKLGETSYQDLVRWARPG